MNGSLTIKVDTREFNRALHELIRHSSRDYATVVNSEAFNLCNEAIKQTKAVSKATVMADPALQPTRGFKTVNAYRQRHQLSRLNRYQVREYLEEQIRARVKSCNYVRSGWLAPMAILWSHMKGPDKRFRRRGVLGRGRGSKEGWAVPAHGQIMMKTCEVGMFSTQNPGKFSGRAGNPAAVAEAGLMRAIPIRTQAFIARVREKTIKDCAKYSVKLITG